jgi:hypothetical protein
MTYTAKDYDRALLSPASVFDQPMDVVAADSLTAQQKLEILKRWEAEATNLEVATAENMSGGEPSRLGEVRLALDALSDEETRAKERRPVPTSGENPSKSQQKG